MQARAERADKIRPLFAAEYDRLRAKDFNPDRALKVLGTLLQQTVSEVVPGGHDRVQGDARACAQHFLHGHRVTVLGRETVIECRCRGSKGECTGVPAAWTLEGWEAAAAFLPLEDPHEIDFTRSFRPKRDRW